MLSVPTTEPHHAQRISSESDYGVLDNLYGVRVPLWRSRDLQLLGSGGGHWVGGKVVLSIQISERGRATNMLSPVSIRDRFRTGHGYREGVPNPRTKRLTPRMANGHFSTCYAAVLLDHCPCAAACSRGRMHTWRYWRAAVLNITLMV